MTFYMKGFEAKIDERKNSFVAFRIQTNKLLQLKNQAQESGIDLSELIRKKLESLL